MKTRMMSMLLAALAILTLANVAHASGNWSYWQSCGDEVSVSFTQVTSDTWTWKFRNDGATTITQLEFWYTDRDGRHYDIMPLSLRPGQVFGGWAAFTASSCPVIQIKTIRRR